MFINTVKRKNILPELNNEIISSIVSKIIIYKSYSNSLPITIHNIYIGHPQ
jgi:hypothetical protein